MSELGVALVGCGTVGSAVVDRWRAAAFPEGARLVGVAVRDVTRRTGLPGLRLTSDALALVGDPDGFARDRGQRRHRAWACGSPTPRSPPASTS